MNFIELWAFFRENKDFFEKMAYAANIKIDYNKEKFYYSDIWSADSFYLLMLLFRKKFEDSGPSSDNEFTRINKLLYNLQIKLPFGKKEYDEYINYDNTNQRILEAIETVLGASDGMFMIPTKEYSMSMFKNLSLDMENILSGLFIYEGKKARYYVDIYDRLTGFEVFLDGGTIFIPVKFTNIPRSAFNENRLIKFNEKEVVSIYDIRNMSAIKDEACVYIPEEFTDSIHNVVKYFNSFDISGDDDFTIMMIESIAKISNNEPIITVNGELVTKFLSEMIIDLYSKHGASSVAQMIDIARVVTFLNKVNRGIIIDTIASNISSDIVDLLKPYIDGSNDDYIIKVSELINNKDIELVARIVRLNGETSSIRFYNKKMRYYKDFNVDKNGVSNELIPELGGFRFISSYCGISEDNIPSGFKTSEAFILYAVLKVIHSEFGSLPLFDRFYGSGMHRIGEKIVFNSKNSIYGLKGKHSYNGVLFHASDIDVSIPKTRPTKAQAASAIREIADKLKGFVASAEDRHILLSVMLCSSIVLPLTSRGNKFNIAIYNASLYTRDGIKERIFRGCFRNANVINTESDFVIKNIADGSTSILVTDIKKSIEKIIVKLAQERYGTETLNRLRNTENITKNINTVPILVFSEDQWIVDESFVFNFPARIGSEAGSFLYDTDDISHTIIQYIMNNFKKIKIAEDKFILKVRKKLKIENINSRHPYIDFFEKILPAMCLVEITGFMDGWEFHDRMYKTFFNDSTIHSIMNIERLLLSIEHGNSKVEDKLFDDTLRMNQNGDLIAVDKIYHMSYIDKDNTDNYILLFKKREVYEIIKDDVGMTYVDFSIFIDGLKSAILIDNAMRNYRVGHDKTKTIYNWYNEIFGHDKDNFAAIKINKKAFYKL